MDAEAELGGIDKDGHAHALAVLLGRLRRIAGPADADDSPDARASVRELVETLGPASFTSLLLVPALIVVSPLSGIPFLPTLCGLSIALIALQMSFGRQHIWLPDWILRRTMDRKRFLRALTWLDRPAGWIDSVTAQRLAWLTRLPFRSLLLAACALAGGAMPFLEILPFTSSILASAVVLIALGLLVGDGLAALLGLGFIGGGISLIVWLVG
ncbi:exopolysaccharide biosynthesis protein [Frigidibacter sp. ROC022]|uniref:exopolysaccharide biosynthesis protein n=1 Tax=Frigidibacter sp. ROC022 TaxID=2971796 RepID=UPI00215B62DB|nr:exopolysaccharide biosynthesis protein [Frigidibacter sp. ROC022]MCR8725620.1 exopolysaccharide biosynthesis protein [Frigidibacter sp. ROC022]